MSTTTDPTPADVPNCLTVDVEDYFQVTGFEDRVCRKDWDKYESRVGSSTDLLLSIFDEHEVLGTFFVLGWVADRYPALVKRIAAAGHEVASHGYWHQLVYNLTPEEFAKDICDSREAIFNACGVEATAYRAPSFSIVPRSRWALDILAENGFTTDSSIFPIAGHGRYGDPDAPRNIHTIQTPHGNLTEFPPTAGSFGRFPLPIGGGYFRLFPLRLTQQAIRHVRSVTGPAMFYTHPWEFDPEQPRIPSVSQTSKIRHFVGLKHSATKLRTLLTSHPFAPLGEIVKSAFPVQDARASQTKAGLA